MEIQTQSVHQTYDQGHRVVLADDNAEFMANVCELIDEEWEVVAAVGDATSALLACFEFRPDLLILDISLGDPNGIELAKLLNARSATPKILFLTIHDEPEIVFAALSTGAAGYMLKARVSSELPLAILALKAGERFVSPGLR
jgi:two-component system response regulator NreC